MPDPRAADPSALTATEAVHELWQACDLPVAALGQLDLTGTNPGLASSFAVGVAAQATVAAAALAAAEIRHVRGGARQKVQVDVADAAFECTGLFSIDGKTPEIWEKYSGLYPCGGTGNAAPGFVRIHANFAHHRDIALGVLRLRPGDAASPADLIAALRSWRAEDFEQAVADAGGVASARRTFATWSAHPQAAAIARQPLLTFEKIGEAPPRELPSIGPHDRPLSGLRVLDLTRILAGPVGGRTLAAYGADVLMINGPHLPNISAIADTSRGKRSAVLDLRTEADCTILAGLVRTADVFMQGYRPGGIAGRGFGPQDLAALRPGIVAISLSAYGHDGPWSQRRGFDSLVQTATGFNDDEAQAFGSAEPKALPMQVLDYATGFLMAYGASAAMLRQAREGGSWHVRVSLARTGQWLRSLGRTAIAPDAQGTTMSDLAARLVDYPSGFGALRALPHAALFAATPAAWTHPSVAPGTNAPVWV